MTTNNLVVYLPCDTSTTQDLCGNTWHADGTPSIVNQTLQLDGSSYVQSDDTFTLGGKDFTISCKVSMDSASPSWTMLFEATTAKGAIPRIEISRYGTNNKFIFYAYELWNLSPNFNVPVNQVFHLEFDYSHSAGKFYVFVDGSLVSTTNKSLAQKTFAALTVGANTRGSSKWLGSIDEFIIYDGVALHDANFTPPTADEYSELKLALGARAHITAEFDVERKIKNRVEVIADVERILRAK